MKQQDLFNLINFSTKLRYYNTKISYFILKPNSARNYSTIIDEIQKYFQIIDQYAILNYNKINDLLHKDQVNAKKYLLPISKYYNDFYGDYAILVLISKKNIHYEDFCLEIYEFKKKIRIMLSQNYFSLVFNTSEIGEKNNNETIEIISSTGTIIEKDSMNENGTFMIFTINEIHSPDFTLKNTINELKLLISLNVFEEKNRIDFKTCTMIRKYKSYEFLKDLN